MKHAMLIGEKVYLRPLELEDIDRGWLEWITDPRISGNLNIGGRYPTTREDLEQYYHKSKPPNAVMFAICDKEDDHYIGNARLSGIDWQHRKCAYGRLIGDLDYHGKGFGTDALILILRYAFINLGMNRVYTVVFADNEASIQSNEKVGMKCEGVERQSIFKNGRYRDIIMFAMLREEFDQLYGNPSES